MGFFLVHFTPWSQVIKNFNILNFNNLKLIIADLNFNALNYMFFNKENFDKFCTDKDITCDDVEKIAKIVKIFKQNSTLEKDILINEIDKKRIKINK